MRGIRNYIMLLTSGAALFGLLGFVSYQAVSKTTDGNGVPPVAVGAAAGTSSSISGAPARTTFNFPKDLVDQVNSTSLGAGGSTPAYSGYTRLTDENEALTVFVPKEWSDIDAGEWTYQGQKVGTYIQASSDLYKFNTEHSVPGIFIGASKKLANQYSTTTLLAAERPLTAGGCNYRGQMHYGDAFYLGDYDYSLNCAGGGQNLIVATAQPPNRDYVVLVKVLARNKADLEAAAEILNTFQVTDDPDRGDH